MKQQRFRARLIVMALAPLVVAMVAQGLYTAIVQRDQASHGIERKLTALESMMVDLAGPSMALDDAPGVDEALGRLEHDEDFAFAIAVDTAGNVVAYRGPKELRAEARRLRSEGILHSGMLVTSTSAVKTGDRQIGVISTGLYITRVHAEARNIAISAAVFSIIGTLIALFVVLRLTRQIMTRSRDMSRLLSSVEQALLRVNADGVLAAERSKVAHDLFGPHVPGEMVWEALARLDPKTASWLQVGWDALRDGALPLELCLDQLPSTLISDGRTFQVVYKPRLVRDVLLDVLVVITDVSAEVARRNTEASEREFINVIERLRRDRVGTVEFIEESEQSIRRIRAATLPTVTLKREIHTLKGNSALFGLGRISEACHAIEDALELQPDRLDVDAVEKLLASWHDIRSKLEHVFGTDLSEDALRIESSDIVDLKNAIERKAGHAELRRIVDGWRFERVELRLGRFAEQMQHLAAKLGKAALDVRVVAPGIRLDATQFRDFWSSFAHIVRNTVDHGIESTAERVDAGKSAVATVRLAMYMVRSNLHLEVIDDGRGIDWERLAERARSNGLPATTRDHLVAAMFSDGISTREEVTDLSGRGAGLAAVRQACEALDAAITVESEPGRGTRFLFVFPGERGLRVTAAPIRGTTSAAPSPMS